MVYSNGYIMSGDREVVRIENGEVISIDKKFAPLHFMNNKDFTSWLESRAIDSHRANSRLLKKVLRLANRDDANTALAVNAVTITDNYWFKPDGENLTWADVISLAPNYDNNIALIANGYPSDVTREKDGLMKFFFEFIDNNLQAKQMFKSLDIPAITKDMIETCLDKIPISVDKNFIINFILNGQKIIKNHID